MPLLKFSKPLIASVLFASLSGGCMHFESSHHGVVIDKDTKGPIQNALVSEKLSYRCLLPISPAGSDMEDLGHIEAKTGVDGNYTLQSKFYLLPPLLCSVKSSYTYSHPEYVADGYHQGFPWDIPAPEFVTVKLTKKKPPIPNTGNESGGPRSNTGAAELRSCIVRELLDSEGYTYIRCEQGKDSVWLAVYPMKLALGEGIYYQDVQPLTNFQSKSLNYTFPEIRFLPGISRAHEQNP